MFTIYILVYLFLSFCLILTKNKSYDFEIKWRELNLSLIIEIHYYSINQLMRSASISSSEAAGPAFAADTGAAGNTSGFIIGAEGKSRFPISSSCFTLSDSSYSSSSIRAFN